MRQAKIRNGGLLRGVWQWTVLFFCLLSLISCGGGGSDSQAKSFTVGATVTGLDPNSKLTLTNTTGDELAVDGNGSFVFATPIAYDGDYSVTVKQQPDSGVCTVSNATGSGVTANVNNVKVICSTTTVPITGNVSGLNSSDQIVLLNNAADPITVDANGSFAFPTPIAKNSSYSITVSQQPSKFFCVVSNATGSGITSNINNIDVNCLPLPRYTIGGSVSGLAGTDQVTLFNNGGSALIVKANGTFVFPKPSAMFSSYSVTVNQQPVHGVCTVSNGTGRIITSNVTNIKVVCSANTNTIGGSVTGLAAGNQVTLLNNGADALTVNTNRAFTFAIPVAYNGSYSVTVGTQPFGQLCSVTNGVGTNVTASVSSVGVRCFAGVVSTMTSFSTYAPYSEGFAISASGNMYVADAANNVIYKVTPDGTISIFAGQYGSTGPNYYADGTGTAAVFNGLRGIALDSNENLYVADSNNQVVRKITPAGVVSLYAGTPGQYSNTDGPLGTGKLFRPNAITVDANGIVYVTDMNLKIRKITPDQTITTVASLTGPAYGLVIDPSDPTNPNHIFYVTDYSNAAVFRINRDGTMTTIAGIPGGPGYKDGNALGEALFTKPFGLARDIYGALYVADSGNLTTTGHSIRKISPDGTTVSTVAGSGTPGYADGTGAAALFNTPKGVAIDSNGTIYVGDAVNRQIRVVK